MCVYVYMRVCVCVPAYFRTQVGLLFLDLVYSDRLWAFVLLLLVEEDDRENQ